VGIGLLDLRGLFRSFLGQLLGRADSVALGLGARMHPQAYYPRHRPITRFAARPAGNVGGMQLSLLLIVIGIILAILVNYGLGLACILIGLVLLIWPRLRTTA
jgi:hypothetical protein